MRRVPLILIVVVTLALAGWMAGTSFVTGADRGDYPDRGGTAAGGSGGGPPGPPMKGSPDEGRFRDGMRPAPMFRDITDQDITEIMAFVAENMPWMKADLEKQKDSDPARFRQMCRHLRFEIDQLKALKQSDPEAFKNAMDERQLRASAHDLAAKVVAATDPKDRDALKEQLRTVLGQLFDKEMAVRNAQIAQVEKRLQDLRKDLQQRLAARQNVVNSRMDDMLKAKPEGPGDRPAPTPTDKAAATSTAPAPAPDATR